MSFDLKVFSCCRAVTFFNRSWSLWQRIKTSKICRSIFQLGTRLHHPSPVRFRSNQCAYEWQASVGNLQCWLFGNGKSSLTILLCSGIWHISKSSGSNMYSVPRDMQIWWPHTTYVLCEDSLLSPLYPNCLTVYRNKSITMSASAWCSIHLNLLGCGARFIHILSWGKCRLGLRNGNNCSITCRTAHPMWNVNKEPSSGIPRRTPSDGIDLQVIESQLTIINMRTSTLSKRQWGRNNAGRSSSDLMVRSFGRQWVDLHGKFYNYSFILLYAESLIKYRNHRSAYLVYKAEERAGRLARQLVQSGRIHIGPVSYCGVCTTHKRRGVVAKSLKKDFKRSTQVYAPQSLITMDQLINSLQHGCL